MNIYAKPLHYTSRDRLQQGHSLQLKLNPHAVAFAAFATFDVRALNRATVSLMRWDVDVSAK